MRDAAASIIDVFREVEGELPPAERYVGDSFGISTLCGLYYSYDDVRFDDERAIREIDEEIRQECQKLAATSGA